MAPPGDGSARAPGRAGEARLGGRILVSAGPVALRAALYHAALEVVVPEGRLVVEMTPVGRGDGSERGVVAEGPVGTRAAGRFRLVRYEVRCWRGSVVPDAAEAVESPRRVSDDPRRARRLLDLVPEVPRLVWGRDELGAGEMWSSNSLVSWLLGRSGLDADSIRPPAGGRAPGWRAGVVLAERQLRAAAG